MKKSDKDELLKILVSLKKYCHAKNCDGYDSCPEVCGCKHKKLGIDTAIAWEIAFLIERYIDKKVTLNYIKAVIVEQYWIVKHHKEKYNSLYLMLFKLKGSELLKDL